MKKIMMIAMLIAVAGVLSATTWYVDDDGNDNGDGTQSNPYNSIQQAIDQVPENNIGYDEIIIADGNYDEFSLTLDQQSIHFIGNESNPSACNIITDFEFIDYNIGAIDREIKFIGLNITADNGISEEISISGTGDFDFEIRDSMLNYFNFAFYNLGYVSIENSTIYGNLEENGIRLHNCNNYLIKNNTIERYDNCINILRDYTQNNAEKAFLQDNLIKIKSTQELSANSFTGIISEDENISINNNLFTVPIYNNIPISAIILKGNDIGWAGQTDIRNNTVILNSESDNNHFVEFNLSQLAPISHDYNIINNVVTDIMNNNDHCLQLSVFLDFVEAVEISYNLFDNQNVFEYLEDEDYHAIGNTFADPLFADEANGDYSLSINSPCLDAGDPDSDGDGFPFPDDPNDDFDPDGTRTDMGYKYLPYDNRELVGKGYNWLSFPRLAVDANGQQSSEEVLENLEPMPAWLDLYFGDDNTEVQSYGFNTWSDNYMLTRTRGYKINKEYLNGNYTLKVAGERIDESTSLSLSSNNENWVGYFCEESSSPEVALADIWNDFSSVKHHDWYLYRKHPGGTVYGQVSFDSGFEYGDMAVIEMFTNDSFTWNYDGARVSSPLDSQVFTYEEKADYTPIYLELDSSTDAEEVGVYVDGNCKGSAYVNDDETVSIRAYLDEPARAGDSEIEFILYNGARGSRNKLTDYKVYDEELETMVTRKIKANDGKDFYHISMRKDENTVPEQESFAVRAYPNPFNPTTTISFYIPESQNVNIEIYNIRGQKIKTLWTGKADEGKNRVVWHGNDASNKPVSSGIYFYRISTENETQTKKLMLLK